MPLPASLGLIGAGAFGRFAIRHLAPHFPLLVHDPHPSVLPCNVPHAPLAAVARQPIVILCVPVPALRATAEAIAPYLKPGALVLDVCSIKSAPLAILHEVLPAHVDIIGTHPLFGPQSGRDGIAGQGITLCPVRRRRRIPSVARFLAQTLKLRVIHATAEAHDQEMAYIQGLTHLVARIVTAMDVPKLDQVTTTFTYLMCAVDNVSADSETLFRTITRDNKYVPDVTARFFAAARDIEGDLT